MALSSIFSYVSLAVVILVGVHLLLTGEVTILLRRWLLTSRNKNKGFLRFYEKKQCLKYFI